MPHIGISELQAPSKFQKLSMESMQSHFKIKMTQWMDPDTIGRSRRMTQRYAALLCPVVSAFSGPPSELAGVLSREHLGTTDPAFSVHHELGLELMNSHS